MLLSRLLPSGLLVVSLFASTAVIAADRDEAARIRTAVARGELMPLPRILAIARARVPGEMLEVELEEERGRIAYEVKILTADGRMQEVTIDPRSGRVLGVEDD